MSPCTAFGTAWISARSIASSWEARKRAAYADAWRQRPVVVEAENEQPPAAVPVGADSPTTPFEVVDWSQINMVGETWLCANHAVLVAPAVGIG
jgi:hypothetical protein